MDNKPKKTKEQIKEEQRKRGNEIGRKNLIPFNELDPQKALEIRQAGHKAMMEVKAKRKTIKEVMEMITDLNVEDIAENYVDTEIIDKAREVSDDLTAYDLIGLAQLQNAIKGSTKSAEFIRDSKGERPKDIQEISVDIITDSDRAMLENINNRLDSLEAIDTNISKN